MSTGESTIVGYKSLCCRMPLLVFQDEAPFMVPVTEADFQEYGPEEIFCEECWKGTDEVKLPF